MYVDKFAIQDHTLTPSGTLPVTRSTDRPARGAFRLTQGTRPAVSAGWAASDLYRQCVAGCAIRRGAQMYRDQHGTYCPEHAPRDL